MVDDRTYNELRKFIFNKNIYLDVKQQGSAMFLPSLPAND